MSHVIKSKKKWTFLSAHTNRVKVSAFVCGLLHTLSNVWISGTQYLWLHVFIHRLYSGLQTSMWLYMVFLYLQHFLVFFSEDVNDTVYMYATSFLF